MTEAERDKNGQRRTVEDVLSLERDWERDWERACPSSDDE